MYLITICGKASKLCEPIVNAKDSMENANKIEHHFGTLD